MRGPSAARKSRRRLQALENLLAFLVWKGISLFPFSDDLITEQLHHQYGCWFKAELISEDFHDHGNTQLDTVSSSRRGVCRETCIYLKCGILA